MERQADFSLLSQNFTGIKEQDMREKLYALKSEGKKKREGLGASTVMGDQSLRRINDSQLSQFPTMATARAPNDKYSMLGRRLSTSEAIKGNYGQSGGHIAKKEQSR
jgi:hypothetical protein